MEIVCPRELFAKISGILTTTLVLRLLLCDLLVFSLFRGKVLVQNKLVFCFEFISFFTFSFSRLVGRERDVLHASPRILC